ncbi:S8 family serine peptidase [Psychromarinibacter sp. C21-152]|uniref:S8 family serine peptidase n=1 Tax=Psychromarinibacter sediminicola TaxID=3033385 RepID=A0AAE3T751_9RHOB|nr:S8 family serine peptidase [Psychromarinibacter sediminicola]MDF0599258.1 S8 family serine peptidase [Psychromarinibacter sediminicola]
MTVTREAKVGDWTQRDRGFKGTPAAIVEPYEDWEHATRPHQATAGAEAPPWQPVHIRLTADAQGRYAPHARALLDHLGQGADKLALGLDAQRILARLITREPAGDPVDHLRYLFVYRPEDESYTALEAPDGTPLYEVRHVGMAVPPGFVARTANAATGAQAADAPARPDIVVTAVIDDAIGVANERFRAGRETRVQHYWVQAVEAVDTTRRPATVAIGQEFDKAELDALLAAAPSEDAFYRALRREAAARAGAPATTAAGRYGAPGFRLPVGQLDTHGTHVMDLAGGAAPGSAPSDRPLVAVEVPAFATLDTSGARLNSFALQALQRILDWADSWTDPDSGETARVSLVVNFSFGIAAGPKDGTGFLEAEMARLIDARNAEGLPTKLVVPAGNTYRDQLTAAARIAADDSRSIDWRVSPADHSVSFLELRLPSEAHPEITLTAPNGDSVTVDGTTAVHAWHTGGSTPVGAIYVRPSPGIAGRTRITLALAPTVGFDPDRRRAPAGLYRVSVRNSGRTALPLWCDVQRDDTPAGYPIHGRQSYLEDAWVRGVDPELKSYDRPTSGSAVCRGGTMSAFATSASPHVFAVGGSHADDTRPGAADPETRAPTRYTAAGPTRGTAARNPALAAISEEGRAHPGVLAAGTYSGSTSLLSGTSAAAPQIARAIADILAADPGADRDTIISRILRAPPRQDARLGAGVAAGLLDERRRPHRRHRL